MLQRAAWARITVGGQEVAAIGPGLVALVGVAEDDTPEAAVRMADKTVRLRLFPGGDRPFDLALAQAGGELLVVSQLTLLGDVRRGNRPSWASAAPPEVAAPLVESYAAAAEAQGVSVRRGQFGAHMALTLENDGPVTLTLDSAALGTPRRHGR